MQSTQKRRDETAKRPLGETPTARWLRCALIALVSAWSASSAVPETLPAQGTALVTSDDPAYRDLDRLAELGLLDSAVIGQRPYSRREMSRIVRVAAAQVDSVGDATARAIVKRLQRRFGAGSGAAEGSEVVHAFDGGTLAFTSTDAARRGFPGNISRATEATIDPLADRRLGRPAAEGQTLALEVDQRLEPTSWLAFRARERVEARSPRDTSLSKTDGEVLLASVRARFGNLAFTAGREQFTWSQGEGDGLLIASDAPALDQISIAGDRPFRLPWLLSRLGPTQATILLADLGPSAVRSHSKLLAYKVSVQPRDGLELGAAFLDHYEGVGGAPSGIADRLVDFLPFIDIFRRHAATDTTGGGNVDSDKQLGVDGRWRVHELGDLLVTGELLIDDFDYKRIPTLFTWDGSSSLGLTFPRLWSPDWSLKLSAKHMGIRTYTHGIITDGITTRGRLLGDELGPDAKAFGVRLDWTPARDVRLMLDGRSAIYSDADYNIGYTAGINGKFVAVLAARRPDELRDRLIGTFEVGRGDGLSVMVRAGGEHIRNYLFRGTSRYDYVVDVALRVTR